MLTKNRSTSFLLFLFSFCFSITVNSQQNFITGSIFTLKGDTIQGFIDYRNWENNPSSIDFKELLNNQVTNFNPMTIKGFKVSNELFVSAVIDAEISPRQTNELNYDNEIKLRKDTTFLQSMFQGTKNLYFYSDRIGKQNFYISQWPDFELLTYKKYLKNVNRVISKTENLRFIGQLKFYLQDCPAIQAKINTAAYNKKALENIFKAYYNCTQGKINYQYIQEKPRIDFGILAGASATKLKLLSSEYEGFKYIKNVDYSSSLNFSGGLYMDYILARNQRKWSIYNELLLNSYMASSHIEDYYSEEKYTIIDAKIGLSYVKLNSMLRFTYPLNQNLKVFINAGMSNGYAIRVTNSLVKEVKFYAQPSTSAELALKDIRVYEQGFIYGIGSAFKKYSFEARHEIGNGMSLYTALESKATRIYFLLGYRF